MQVRNSVQHNGYLTIRQWAKKGYLPKQDAKGIVLWTNQFCKHSYMYYSPDEVEQASKEALNAYWKPERERRAANRKTLAAKRQAEEDRKQRETELYIESLEQQIRELSSTLTKIIPLCNLRESEIHNEIVIDIETTGLNPDVDEILQVSIISKSGETLYNSYIKPIFASEWKEAQRINHINPEMVADAPNIYAEMPKINSILLNANKIIGYNHENFDIPFLERYGAVLSEAAETFDVMLAFSEIYGEWSEYHGDYKWQKLTTCAAYYNYQWGEDAAHDSLADCKATLHCYECLKKELEKESINNE